jgi:FkbM family methyltransferase
MKLANINIRMRKAWGKMLERYCKYTRKSIILRDSFGFRYEFQPEDTFFYYVNSPFFVIDDPSILFFIKRCVKSGDTVFDVGACIGPVSILLGKLVGAEGRVFSFEAEQINYRRVCRNVELNDLHSVIPQHLAVTSYTGMTKSNVFSRTKNGWNTLGWFELNGAKPIDIQNVSCVTLDSFCVKKNILRINLLKVDVEGAEPEVFKGASQLLKSHLIERIIFEISVVPLQGMDHKISDTIFPLTSAGYTIWQINKDGSLREFRGELDNIYFCNLVALAPGIEP